MQPLKHPAEVQEILDHLDPLRGDVPLHRRESRQVYSFSKWPFTEQLSIWDEVWHSQHNFWIKLHAYFFLERHLKKDNELVEMWPVIVKWQALVDDWGLCDSLAKVYTKILEVREATVYAQLKAWNTDEDKWKRRQSLVSLLYYSRTKKRFLTFSQIEQLIHPLLKDKEYYAQKGDGWAFRELGNVYPTETFVWLKTHIRSVSSIAFTIALEKMDTHAKDELKMLRKPR